MFINDLPAAIENVMALFADDSKCRRVIKDINDCMALQDDLESLQCKCVVCQGPRGYSL